MSLFENHKVLHGLPHVGQQIQFTRKTQSWFTNVNEDQDKLVINQTYTVRKTQLNSSSTYVWLQEFPNIFDENDPSDGRDQPLFNLSSFKWLPPSIDFDALIGLDARQCMYHLNRVYSVGIFLNGNKAHNCEGDPEINLEYNPKTFIITKAEWRNINMKPTNTIA